MSQAILNVSIRPYLKNEVRWIARIDDQPEPTIYFEAPAITVEDGADGGRTYTAPRPVYRQDLHEMRAQLFATKNQADALRFAEEYGPLDVITEAGRLPQASPLPVSRLLARRDFYRKALFDWPAGFPTQAHDEQKQGVSTIELIYLYQDLGDVQLHFGNLATIDVRCNSVETALRTCNFLDRSKGSPWQECDICRRPFENTTGRKRKYCGPKCAHLHAVRNYNTTKRPNKAAPQPK